MAAWFVDRALPGIFSGALLTIAVAISHVLTGRRDARAEQRQRDHLERLTAEQTATLTAGCSCNHGTEEEEATMTETPAPPPQCRSLHVHVPHPHLKHRAEAGPVKVAASPAGKSAIARFNTRAAVIVTRAVGTMYCAYAFCLLAFYGLPAGLHAGAAGFVQWASSQFIQLVLLPIIIVGGAVLAEATDRMNKRQFDDVEALLHGQDQQAQHLAAQDAKILALEAAQATALDLLDEKTDGGVKTVLDAVGALAARIDGKGGAS